MPAIEFTCTACRRPEILLRTLTSFRANLRGIDWGGSTLHLNVDPLPSDGPEAQAVADVAAGTFGRVMLHAPPAASFPAAVKWCWQRPGSPVFFHLEDDWELRREVQVADMLEILDLSPAAACVNLRAYRHDDDRICLAPGLWRTAVAREIAGRMRTDANPERQLRPVSASNPHGGLHGGYRGVQFPRERNDKAIFDIGREWMGRHKLERDGGRLFTAWKAR